MASVTVSVPRLVVGKGLRLRLRLGSEPASEGVLVVLSSVSLVANPIDWLLLLANPIDWLLLLANPIDWLLLLANPIDLFLLLANHIDW